MRKRGEKRVNQERGKRYIKETEESKGKKVRKMI